MLVSIDDLPAVCTGVCNYTYAAPQGLLTEMLVSETVVTLKGQDLPLDDIIEIKLAHTLCDIISNTTSEIICNLVTPWVFGEWLPAVRTSNGLVPIKDTVAFHVVPNVLTSMSPEALNPAGGDIMTVIGENFPSNCDDFPGFSLSWSDGTPCTVLTCSSTMVTC